MGFIAKIRLFFLMHTVRRLSKGRGGRYAQARDTVEELYRISCKRNPTSDDVARISKLTAFIHQLME